MRCTWYHPSKSSTWGMNSRLSGSPTCCTVDWSHTHGGTYDRIGGLQFVLSIGYTRTFSIFLPVILRMQTSFLLLPNRRIHLFWSNFDCWQSPTDPFSYSLRLCQCVPGIQFWCFRSAGPAYLVAASLFDRAPSLRHCWYLYSCLIQHQDIPRYAR